MPEKEKPLQNNTEAVSTADDELIIPDQPASRRTLLQKTRDALAVLFSSKVATVGLVMVLFWVFVAIFAPLVTQYTPLEQDWKAPNQGPSKAHFLGTDELGRDLWSRLVYGARVVLVILPITEKYWIPGGTAIWGVLAALFVGTMMAVPIILLYLIIMAALGASAFNVVLAITIVGTPGIARLVRSLTLDIRTREYIRAAETRGENPWYIMFVEILPNARGPIIVDAMLRVGYAIFAMGTLGFLGLGLPPPSPDWGSMVAKGREFILSGSPWAALWPSVAIASLVIGLNLLADGLREESMRYQ
jgi:peptide/nickel transport system permease protein